jgi:hypothetical protein
MACFGMSVCREEPGHRSEPEGGAFRRGLTNPVLNRLRHPSAQRAEVQQERMEELRVGSGLKRQHSGTPDEPSARRTDKLLIVFKETGRR